ncbi:MAG TPA: class I SAM-dependent methyltransferase [Stellaceae bacterium]|nr:class I SAM-dependent methyltransferase [Stellaceae bacterium]
MSQPFIIWTMQRTGGTSLTDLLMEMSEHEPAEHEPFNRDRQFGQVTIAWGSTKDEAALRRALADILAQRYLIKHTYELRDMRLNLALMEAAGQSYRHIFLYRRDELSRLVSKFVAQANGTWFKGDYASTVYGRIQEGERRLAPLPVAKLVGAYRRSRAVTEEIRASFNGLDLSAFTVAYEDIYQGERAARLARLAEMFEFLGFSPEAVERHRASIEEKIFGGGQNTRAIAPHVPNLAQVIRAVREAGYQPPPGGLGTEPLPEAAAEPEAEAPWHRTFVGGLWDEIGGLQFEFLKAQGLEPQHRLLDIGCGSLRAGVKLVPYLEPDHYFGIDAKKKLLDAGYREELMPAGLADRLPRANLCCSQRFEHGGLPDRSIDFGICAAVFTRLPLDQLGLMLRHTAKYFRPGGKLYVSFHEAEDGAAKRWHYSRVEMAAAAERTGWRARHIGEWGHPRGQKMMEYERV